MPRRRHSLVDGVLAAAGAAAVARRVTCPLLPVLPGQRGSVASGVCFELATRNLVKTDQIEPETEK
jgi:hypothetical protein